LSKPIEIRWHGRGGQGAKTAALMFAEAVSAGGKFVQGFPEYGAERMGAPILAFNRISERPITIHSNVTDPEIVVVLDETLVGKAAVTDGLPPGGAIIVNTKKSPAEMKKRLGSTDVRVFTVDANQIALEALGMPIPNTPMMGALVRVSGLVPMEEFMELAEKLLYEKFRGKTNVVPGNLEAIRRAYQEVKGE
jgi:pyruvate ferredoxin oxidoreductase gamma subunit